VQKLLLLSIVFAVLGIPVSVSRDRSAVRAVKKTVVLVAAFNFLYLLIVLFLYARLQ
jgi:hypothetical protein